MSKGVIERILPSYILLIYFFYMESIYGNIPYNVAFASRHHRPAIEKMCVFFAFSKVVLQNYFFIFSEKKE